MRYRWIPRSYTVRDQARYSWHGTSGLCRNTNTVGRRDWKIGSIPLPFSSLLSRPSFHPVVLSIISYTRLPPMAPAIWLTAAATAPLWYKYLPIISYLDTQVNITRQSDVVSPSRRPIHLDTFSCKEKSLSPLFTSISGTVLLWGRISPFIT